MRVLLDLKHPAQVLFFKDLVRVLRGRGDDILVTSRAKDETLELLDSLGIPHACLSGIGKGLPGMGLELVRRTARMLNIARRFRPDVLLARTGIVIGLGILQGLVVFAHWLLTGRTNPVRSLLIGTSLFITVGFLMLIFALIADMLDRIIDVSENSSTMRNWIATGKRAQSVTVKSHSCQREGATPPARPSSFSRRRRNNSSLPTVASFSNASG